MHDVVRGEIADFSCSAATARAINVACRSHLEELDLDIERVQAALSLWRRAAPSHPITTVLADLVDHQARHSAALDDLRRRLADLSVPEGSPHQHIEPTLEEMRGIATAIVGPEKVDELQLP